LAGDHHLDTKPIPSGTPRASAPIAFDPRRALLRITLALTIIVAAYLLSIALSAGLAFAGVVPPSAPNFASYRTPGWLTVAALAVSVLAGELKLVAPLAIPPLAAALSLPRQGGSDDPLPYHVASYSFRLSLIIGLLTMVPLITIVAGAFFYAVEGEHHWAHTRARWATGLVFALFLIALTAAGLMVVR
jgi:hypothetical protein